MPKKKHTPEALQKPVHVAILKPVHLQKLADEGRITKTPMSRINEPRVQQPAAKSTEKEVYEPPYKKVMQEASKNRRQLVLRTKLKVIHERLKSPTGDAKPPCNECKTSACCYAFVVDISAEEYESDLYGDYAVKLTAQDAKAIGSGRFARLFTMRTPHLMSIKNGARYVLEGAIGTPCPFLTESGCGIYDKRPATCRIYTCVGDKRITQEMRDGTVDIEDVLTFNPALKEAVEDVENET